MEVIGIFEHLAVMNRATRSSGSIHESVPDKVCRAHLEKVTASATFARAEQLRTLLTWLVERSLLGADAPTEREIGELVLRRKDFDPQADSLVRKEMSRLREKLARYYGREGNRDRVHLRYRGGYLLGFAWADQPSPESVNGRIVPCLLILPFRSHPDLNYHSVQLAEELSVWFAESGQATLVSPTTALSYVGRVGDVREFASECGADFVLEGRLDSIEAQLRVTLWFVNGRTGLTERPGRFVGTNPDELARLAAPWLHEQAVRLTD